MTDTAALVADLHAHLAATAERPVERRASRWLGEAEAVVGDVAGADVDDATLRKRVEQTHDLLEHVDDTGDREANEHLEAARDLTERVLERL